MEFTNDISFDNKLIENKIAKINYHGNLVRNGSNSISIVYGFGSNWDNTDAKEMNKVENGFEANIKMQSFDTFNFCFRDENYNWDNNNYCNYISAIEKEVIEENINVNAEITKEDLTTTQSEVKNIEKEISLLFDTLFSEANNDVQTVVTENQKIVTPSSISSTETEKIESKEFNLDDLIEEILNPIAVDSVSLIEALAPEITTEKDENVQKVNTEFTELPTHTQKTSTLVEDILEPYSYTQLNEISNSDAERINDLDDLIETLISTTVDQKVTQNIEPEIQGQKEVIDVVTPVFETPTKQIETFEKIEGIEDLFEQEDSKEFQNVQKIEEKPTVSTKKNSDFTILNDEENISENEIDTEAETDNEEPSLLEEVIQDKLNSRVEEEVALSVVEENSGLIVSPRKLGKLYFAKKKIKLALYKALVAIPKFLSKQFDSSNNN